MIFEKAIVPFAFFLLILLVSPAWGQQVTVEISGTVTSVDNTLASEFAVGEAIVFTADIDASAGFDVFGANTSIDATRFTYSSSSPATFTSGGDYTGSSNSGQLDFFDNYPAGFPNTAEGFRWEANTFTAPSVNGIPFAQTYIDVELADNTYPGSAISDPSDALNLAALTEPIQIGTEQNSAISFYDGSYHYVRFDVDAINIRTPVQEVTVRIIGTVTSVDSVLSSEFAVGETVVFSALVGATEGFDLFGTSATVDATRFTLLPSSVATFDVGGDYAGSNTVAQLDFYDNYSSGFPNTAEGFRWESNNFTAPAVNDIPFYQTYIDVELAGGTYLTSAIIDTEDAIDLGDLPELIQIGTGQNSALSFNDGTYHYVRFDVDAIVIDSNLSVIDIDGDGVPDTNDPCPADPGNDCNPSGSAAKEIAAAVGGTITTPDGTATANLGGYVLPEDLTVSVTKFDGGLPVADVVVTIENTFKGDPLSLYILEPAGTQFLDYVTLIIDVDVTALSAAERDSLDVYYHRDTNNDGVLDTLEPQDAECVITEDPAATFTASCSFSVLHFSTYVSIAAIDSDGDGILDDFFGENDQCDDEDATGLDADADGCIDRIDGLTELVSSLLDAGVIDSNMKNSLLSKLENVKKSQEKDNICAMINQLEAFNSQIAAQAGKKVISVEAAAKVTAYANNVMASELLGLPEGEACN